MENNQHQEWLKTNVALYRRMPSELQAELLELIPEFISGVRWRGEEGVQVTEEMKVCVAAEACIPILRLRGGLEIYRRLDSVEIFPKDLSKVSGPGVAGDADGRRVRLGWHWAKEGMNNGEDGYNLTIHEFAHIIDFASLDGKADGVPQFDSYSDTRDWEKFVAQNYEDFQRELGKNNESFSDYGSSNEAEFFACATESFFERGEKFRQEWPEIYDRLKGFYGMDPLLWASDVGVAKLTPETVSEPEANPEPEPQTETVAEPEQGSESVPISEPKPEPPEEPEPVSGLQESELIEVKVDARGLGNVTEYHANGKRACFWEMRDHGNDGPWRRWSSQGDIIEEGWYRKGMREGTYKLLHSNGNTRLEGTYRDNRREGKWRLFHEDGKLKQECHYAAGDLVRWEVWQAEGQSKKLGAWD